MTQSPTKSELLPPIIPENATLEERLALVAAFTAQKERRAAALTQIVIEPDSLFAAIKRTEARRVEDERRHREAHRTPPHAGPILAGPIRNAAALPPAPDVPCEDKESSNLLGDETGGQPILSLPSPDAPDLRPTRTAPGQDAAATVERADERAAPPPCEPARFTGGLQNEKTQAARTTLTDEIKQFIVKGLACYDTPSQVAEAATLMFGISISRQLVYRYDPGNPRPPAQRWRDLYAATRQALLRELAEIGVAHRAVRLRRLDRLASRSERNNVATTLKCLEMAAKECGGMYESRRNALPQAPGRA